MKPITRVLCFVALLWFRPVAAFAKQDAPTCDAGLTNATNRREGSIRIKKFDFTWSSQYAITAPASADPSMARYCSCTEARNYAGQPLYYHWEVSEKYTNEGLEPGAADRKCRLEYGIDNPPAEHLLFYGRSGDSTRTYVWEGMRVIKNAGYSTTRTDGQGGADEDSQDNPPAMPPLRLIAVSVDLHSIVFHKKQYFLFVPLPRKAERVRAHLAFSSAVTGDEAGYSIKNNITNLSPDETVFLVQHTLQPEGKKRAGGAAPSAGGGSKSGWSVLASFLRTHLWPRPLPPARPNFYQQQIDATMTISKRRPVLKSRKIEITSPRSLPSVQLNIPVWVPDVENKAEEKTKRTRD